MKPLLVTSGEPSGIGPDLCLQLAFCNYPVVVVCDPDVLLQRAKLLNIDVTLDEYDGENLKSEKVGHLSILPLRCAASVVPGVLNVMNADYVMRMLALAVSSCMSCDFSAVVTAPVQKSIINQAGFAFTGHTEFFAQEAGVDLVVMMLACQAMRVALVTTHLPLKEVPGAITYSLIINVITKIHHALQTHFGILLPKIYVAGLNPHAGEGGYLGREELDVIIPALDALRVKGINVCGPMSADTMFVAHKDCDVFVAMYHDQGLPVLKYVGFSNSVNVTLGLPFVRTSVDHGTALELAGTGFADASSLFAAVALASDMVHKNDKH